jgi:hypothetical protein
MRIILEWHAKGEYKLYKDIEYVYNGKRITVLKGFITDGASIPKMLWAFVGSPYIGNYVEAAVIHDALYAYKRKFTRKEADAVFDQIMKESNVSDFKRFIIWAAVRLFGYPAWRFNDARDDLNKHRVVVKDL